MTMEQKRAIFNRDKWICKYCGSNQAIHMTIDHMTPLSRGGADNEKNMTTACHSCNQLKSNMTVAEFRVWMRAMKQLRKIGMCQYDFKNCEVKSFVFTYHPL